MTQRKFLKTANRALQRALPSSLYIIAARIAFPIFDAKRRNNGVRIVKKDGLYHATSKATDYYFDSPYKVGRYLYREKDDAIEAYLRTRYSYKQVRVDPGDIVLDIGANVGEFTRAVASDASMVISVDPDPSPFRCLTKNIESLDNVTAFNVALGDHDHEANIFLSSEHNNSSLIEPLDGWTEQASVLVITLQTLMSRAGVSRIDFLKLEAEGYEPEILNGAGQALRAVRKIAIDASPERQGKPTKDDCMKILASLGFQLWEQGWMVYGLNTDVKELE